MTESREGKRNLFEREYNVLNESKAFLQQENVSSQEYAAHIEKLNQEYGDILDQSKLITKVSDRLQKKISRVNADLEANNIALQESLDALTKAKVGRKATTIVLVLFIVVFIAVEGFVEPYIDDWAEASFMDDSDDSEATIITITLIVKGTLALLLRPIEKLVEKILMKKELARRQMQR